MNIHTPPDPVHRGHAHDVDLEDTFDFLNTDDTENGFPVDKLPTLDDALAWFVDRVADVAMVDVHAVGGR